MRPGDYITVNPPEVGLLTSDEFKQVASADLVERIRLTPPSDSDPDGYHHLSLPKIGQPVAQALRKLAASYGRSGEGVVAEHLAERIEQRIEHRRRSG